VRSIHRFINDQGVDLVQFRKGERKDDIAQHYLPGHDGTEGVLFVGRAQEKTNVFRTQKRRNPITGKTYPCLVADTAMVNHFYFYGFVRHEAPCHRVGCKDPPAGCRSGPLKLRAA